MLKGYRTILINGIILLITTVLAVVESVGLVDYIPADYMLYYGIGLTILNILLRFITTSPVGKKL